VAAIAASTVDATSGVEVGVLVGSGVEVVVGVGTSVGTDVSVSVDVGVPVAAVVSESVTVGASVGVDVDVGVRVAVTAITGTVASGTGVWVLVLAGEGEGDGVDVACCWAIRVSSRAVWVAMNASLSNLVVVMNRVPMMANAISATTTIPPMTRTSGETDNPPRPVIVGTACVAPSDAASVTRSGGGVGVPPRPGSTDTSFTRGAGAMVAIGIAASVWSAVTPTASLRTLAISPAVW
jgi:hypothetical protein